MGRRGLLYQKPSTPTVRRAPNRHNIPPRHHSKNLQPTLASREAKVGDWRNSLSITLLHAASCIRHWMLCMKSLHAFLCAQDECLHLRQNEDAHLSMHGHLTSPFFFDFEALRSQAHVSSVRRRYIGSRSESFGRCLITRQLCATFEVPEQKERKKSAEQHPGPWTCRWETRAYPRPGGLQENRKYRTNTKTRITK